MGDVSDGNDSINTHLLYQQGWYFNKGDVSCGGGFINRHILYQCNDSILFKDMDRDVENGDVSGVHYSMKSHYIYQNNVLKPLIN